MDLAPTPLPPTTFDGLDTADRSPDCGLARSGKMLATTVLITAVAGCLPMTTHPDGGMAFPPQHDYRDLVTRHNHAIHNVKRLWAFAIVSLRWQEDGRQRHEQGEGQLAVALPGHLSLTIGKVHDLYRIGCDQERYWIIDLSGETTVAHVGRTALASSTSMRELNTAIQPQDLIRLLGLLPIDPLREPDPPAGVLHGRHWLIEPPGTHMRMLLDPQSARPQRIDLLDANGYSRVTATMKRYRHIETTGTSPGSWPTIATLIEIKDLETDSVAKISLTEMVGDADAIDARWFDLETLIDALDAEVNDLDRP